MLMGVMGSLDGFADNMKGNLSPDDYASMITTVGASIAEVVVASSRLHSRFPDLVPKELRADS